MIGERRFARHYDERAAFLEHYVGRSFDQIATRPLRDTGNGRHAAGTNDHRLRCIRATRERRGPLLRAEDAQLTGRCSHSLAEVALDFAGPPRQLLRRFHADDHLRGLRQREVYAAPGIEQTLQQSQAVLRARRTRHGEGDRAWLFGRSPALRARCAEDRCAGRRGVGRARPPNPPLLMISTWSPALSRVGRASTS